ncbi:menaquinone biosynthetic enzyme MqnA/MqnD family protein [Poriferisphaera sp. WC338]|uniref:menaquinone biosynthetic enzyme MqnA/MqnD family protein n=1 Tax=Poriferisphaera sp. WC338 TaxID=3425129 RepID=UPI003D8146C3
MQGSSSPLKRAQQAATHPFRVGCVSYLNAKPLIEGLAETGAAKIDYRVPAALLAGLESGETDLALCPFIDYFRSKQELVIVPSGGIGCAGPTLTVRLFSQIPLPDVTDVYADTDSHTSVALLKILMSKMYQTDINLIDYDAREHTSGGKLVDKPEAMLLIGDKVVSDAPCGCAYSHQLDLGQAWWELTGKPFVFAVWMCRKDAALARLPILLSELQLQNDHRIDEIAETYAPKHHWSVKLAQQYLGDILRYTIGKPELEGMKLFAQMAGEMNLISDNRPLRVMTGSRF